MKNYILTVDTYDWVTPLDHDVIVTGDDPFELELLQPGPGARQLGLTLSFNSNGTVEHWIAPHHEICGEYGIEEYHDHVLSLARELSTAFDDLCAAGLRSDWKRNFVLAVDMILSSLMNELDEKIKAMSSAREKLNDLLTCDRTR